LILNCGHCCDFIANLDIAAKITDLFLNPYTAQSSLIDKLQ